MAQTHGHEPGTPVIGAPPVFYSSPHQPGSLNGSRRCCWTSLLWPKKYAAFREMKAQEHLWHYYERVALQRGVQASRNSNKNVKYGEAYQRVFPHVTEELQ